MSTNKDLFKEAIADAKAVREAALANAKAALEEALTPKLQSMISAKLQEMDYEEEELEEMDISRGHEVDRNAVGDYGKKQYIKAHAMSENDEMEEEEELEEDFDLASILAELNDEEEELEEAKKKKEEIEEAKKEEEEEELEEAKKEEEELEEAEEEEAEESEEEENGEEAEGDKITDLSVDELKDIIKDIIHSELEAEEMETPADEEEEMGDMGGEEEMVDLGGEEEVEEVNLDELLAELDALDEADKEEELEEGDVAKTDKKLGYKKSKIQPMDQEKVYKEAIETIETLRNELNEVNLLNAKLLYVNKIFKAKNLTESQKLKVIASFDKATTPAQAKELFESIQNSDLGKKKESIKESIGFASKAAGVAPKKAIVESDDVITRMQKLANIIK